MGLPDLVQCRSDTYRQRVCRTGNAPKAREKTENPIHATRAGQRHAQKAARGRKIPRAPSTGIRQSARNDDCAGVRELLKPWRLGRDRMATIKVSNFVAAPIDRVFQLFTDIE